MYIINQQSESTLAFILYLLKQTGCAAVPSIKQLKGFKLPGLQPPQQVRNPTHHISFTVLINCSASQQNISRVI